MIKYVSYLVMLIFTQATVGLGQSPAPYLPEGQVLKDIQGEPVNAHGIGILHYQDTYYMFGEIKKGRTRLVPQQNWEDYRVPAGGVSCYSSKDLIHWKKQGVALAATTGNPQGDLDTGGVIERPKVIYNEQTGKFVMWMHIDKSDYSYARAGVAVSDYPQGPYQYLCSIRPNGQMSRDMTVFQDEDGRAYLVYASENNLTMQICLLSADYCSPTTYYKRILVNQNREAPALFKYKHHYYLVTSLCSGWDPNAANYAVADSVMGTWVNRGNPCQGKDAENTFHAQSAFILPLPGKEGVFLFMADQWNKTNLEDSRLLWLPLTLEKQTIRIERPHS